MLYWYMSYLVDCYPSDDAPRGEKTDTVKRLLREQPTWCISEIAEAAGCSQALVSQTAKKEGINPPRKSHVRSRAGRNHDCGRPFTQDRSGRWECVPCHNDGRKARYYADQERERERSRRYSEANKDKRDEWNRTQTDRLREKRHQERIEVGEATVINGEYIRLCATCSINPATSNRGVAVCDPCARTRRRKRKNDQARRRAGTVTRGYGPEHRRLREKWAEKVERGSVFCWRCGDWIPPGSPWDLGHDDDDRTQYRGPEHAACNRATTTRKRERMTAEARRNSREW